MAVMHEEILNRFTLVMQKHVEELERKISFLQIDIDGLRRSNARMSSDLANEKELRAKDVRHLKKLKASDSKSYQKQIETLSEQLLNYDEALKELQNLAVEKIQYLQCNHGMTAKQTIEAALNHISELQETNKKLLGELQKTKDDVIYEKQAKAAWIITYQKEDIKSSKLRKRRNQLIRQLKDNGIEPVKPS